LKLKLQLILKSRENEEMLDALIDIRTGGRALLEPTSAATCAEQPIKADE
jgi:hypothetical protein